MGTRGAYGFRLNDEDKVSYNQFDSYPSELGQQILDFIAKTKITEIKEIAEKIILVNQNSKPTEKQIMVCAPYTDLNVSSQEKTDWYCLLRNAQGDLSVHKKIPYMIDSKTFLADSLFCEWTYIINVDDGVLEVYRGFNHDPKAAGRYAALMGGGDQKIYKKPYYGVKLILTIPLKSIFKANKKKIEKFVKQMEEAAAEEKVTA